MSNNIYYVVNDSGTTPPASDRHTSRASLGEHNQKLDQQTRSHVTKGTYLQYRPGPSVNDPAASHLDGTPSQIDNGIVHSNASTTRNAAQNDDDAVSGDHINTLSLKVQCKPCKRELDELFQFNKSSDGIVYWFFFESCITINRYWRERERGDKRQETRTSLNSGREYELNIRSYPNCYILCEKRSKKNSCLEFLPTVLHRAILAFLSTLVGFLQPYLLRRQDQSLLVSSIPYSHSLK